MGQVAVDATETVDRETLCREVWAQPMTTVAARYGVSSSFLARVCTRLNVPRPPRGYWAKLQVGRAPKKPNLPSPRAGDLLDWSRGGTLPRVAQDWADAAPATTTLSRPRRSSRSTQHEILVGAREHFQAIARRPEGRHGIGYHYDRGDDPPDSSVMNAGHCRNTRVP